MLLQTEIVEVELKVFRFIDRGFCTIPGITQSLETKVQFVKGSSTCRKKPTSFGAASRIAHRPTGQRTPSMAARMAPISAPASLPSEALPAKWLAAERR